MPRPRPSPNRCAEMVKEYIRGKGLKEVGDMFSVAALTVRREVIAAGHVIRPKHIVLNNVWIGRNQSKAYIRITLTVLPIIPKSVLMLVMV